MKTVSEAFKQAIKQADRTLNSRIYIKDSKITLTDDAIVSFDVNNSILDTDEFSLGGCISSSINIEIDNRDKLYTVRTFKNQWIQVFVGLLLPESNYEEVQIGEYKITDVSEVDRGFELSGFDVLYTLDKKYSSKMNFPVACGYLVNSIAKDLKLTISERLTKNDYPNSTMNIGGKPDDLTYRQIFNSVGVMAGGYIVVKNGIIDLINITDTDIVINGFERYDLNVKNDYEGFGIVRINDIAVGTQGNELKLEIPLLDYNDSSSLKTIGELIKKTYSEFIYTGFACNWHGNPALECGDAVTIVDDEGKEIKTFITECKLSYNGGLESDIAAKIGEDENESEDRAYSKIQNQIKEIETGIYYFTNAANFSVSSELTQLCYIEFAVSSDANLMLYCSIQFEGSDTIEAKLFLDNEEMIFLPKVVIDSFGLLSFTIPVTQIPSGQHHGLELKLKGSSAVILTNQAHVTLFGQKLVGGMSDSRPHAEVIEEIFYADSIQTTDGITTDCEVIVSNPLPISCEELITYVEQQFNKVTTTVDVSMVWTGFMLYWKPELYNRVDNYVFVENDGVTYPSKEVTNAGTLIISEPDYVVTSVELPDSNEYYFIGEGGLM